MTMGFKFDQDDLVNQMIIAVGNTIEELAYEIAAEIVAILEAEGHVYTGKLAKTVSVVADGDPMEFVVGTEAPYALYVEWGTRPRSVPFEVIAEWVETKFGLTGKERDDVAWAIIKKISTEGIKGIRFTYRATDNVVRRYGGSQ